MESGLPVDELVRAAAATQRFYAVLLTGSAALALALAAAGDMLAVLDGLHAAGARRISLQLLGG